MFDTGGEERVNFMTLHYYENAEIVCLVYAVDSLASLSSLNAWVEDARDYLALKTLNSVAPVFALVGVKGDIPLGDREVRSEDVERAAKHFDISEDCCFEVSNVSGDGVAEMMQYLAQKVFDLHTKMTTSIELKYSSIKSIQPENPTLTNRTSSCKQWLCCCLCCCKRMDYEAINP